MIVVDSSVKLLREAVTGMAEGLWAVGFDLEGGASKGERLSAYGGCATSDELVVCGGNGAVAVIANSSAWVSGRVIATTRVTGEVGLYSGALAGSGLGEWVLERVHAMRAGGLPRACSAYPLAHDVTGYYCVRVFARVTTGRCVRCTDTNSG